MSDNSTTIKIIEEICKEKEIQITYLSFGWIRELKYNNKIMHIVRNKFDLNPAACMDIVNDKYATYEVLRANGIPVLEYNIIFNPHTRPEFSGVFEKEVERYFEEYNSKIVIKQNNSSEGKGVFLFENKEEAIAKVRELFESEKEDNVNICPFENIECEYRAIYLNGEILYLYKKINSKNSWKHNLANGAKAVEVTAFDESKDIVLDIAKRAGKAVNGKFVTVDVSKTIDGRIFVMEINGSVCMSKFAETFPNGYKITKSIYEKAIDELLK